MNKFDQELEDLQFCIRRNNRMMEKNNLILLENLT